MIIYFYVFQEDLLERSEVELNLETIGAMKVNDLKRRLREINLIDTGPKPILVARLFANVDKVKANADKSVHNQPANILPSNDAKLSQETGEKKAQNKDNDQNQTMPTSQPTTDIRVSFEDYKMIVDLIVTYLRTKENEQICKNDIVAWCIAEEIVCDSQVRLKM